MGTLLRSFLFIILLLLSYISAAQDKHEIKKQVEKEIELVDFNSIKDVLKSDHLDKNVKAKISKVKKIRQKRLEKKMSRFNIPETQDFWMIASETWLVKNVSVLKWNFVKPEYGIEKRVKELFKQLGIINVNFKILLLNTSAVAHQYLPYRDNELLALISVPFIRSLNLSQLEISLLVLEEYVRSREKMIQKKILSKKLSAYIGKNFYKKRAIDFKPFKNVLKKYDSLVFEKGYTFQEQYETTKQLKRLLAGENKIKKSYIALLQKIDNLINSDPDYKEYVRFYPSPQVQINWLLGKK